MLKINGYKIRCLCFKVVIMQHIYNSIVLFVRFPGNINYYQSLSSKKICKPKALGVTDTKNHVKVETVIGFCQ